MSFADYCKHLGFKWCPEHGWVFSVVYKNCYICKELGKETPLQDGPPYG